MKLKKLVLCIVVLCMAFWLTGCPRKRFVENFPQDINSTWRTENGEMEFTILEGYNPVGTIRTAEGEREVYFSIASFGQIAIYPIECVNIDDPTVPLEYSDRIETWDANYYSKDAFRVTVGQSTYFNEGDKFVFRRVDDADTSEDNT